MRPVRSVPTLLVSAKYLVLAVVSVVLCTGMESTRAENPSAPGGAAETPPPSVAAATQPEPSPLSPEETTPLSAPCPDSKDAFVVRFDARSGQLLLPSHRTYAGKAVQVCIQNPDHRMSYSITTTEVPLAKTGGESLLDVLFPKNAAKSEGAEVRKDDRLLGFEKDKARFAAQVTQCQDATLSTEQRLRGVLAYLSPSNAGVVEKLNPRAVRQKLKDKVDDALKVCELFTSDGAKKAAAALFTQIEAEFKNEIVRKTQRSHVETLLQKGLAQVGLLATLQAVEAQLDMHLAPFDRSVIPIATRGNTEVEIVVQAKPLKVAGLQPNPSSDSKAGALTLSYGAATTLARTKLEVRSLSYVRVAVGLGFTSLRNDTVSEQRDAQGQVVLRTGQDTGIAGMILLSHYWYGVDERETQPWSSPWDSTRSKTSLVNLIPSIAIGLPLTQQNTLQNFFVGLLFQPIPAVGLVFGGHVGRINQLRPEFSDGMTLPIKETGFRIDADTLEPVTKMGWFLGVMVTDSVFAKLIRDSLSK